MFFTQNLQRFHCPCCIYTKAYVSKGAGDRGAWHPQFFRPYCLAPAGSKILTQVLYTRGLQRTVRYSLGSTTWAWLAKIWITLTFLFLSNNNIIFIKVKLRLPGTWCWFEIMIFWILKKCDSVLQIDDLPSSNKKMLNDTQWSIPSKMLIRFTHLYLT